MTPPPEIESIERSRSGLPAPRRRHDCFSTEGFLFDLEERPVAAESAEFRVLDRLIKKVVTTNTLRLHYATDLSTKVDDACIAAPYARLFVSHLLMAAEESRDWKFLNAAFDILGGRLIAPELDDGDGQLIASAERVLAEFRAHGA